MNIKTLKDEDFINYKKPSMFIGLGTCDWKCCTEGGFDCSICQNSSLATAKDIEISYQDIYDRYIANPITQSIVIGGLEPLRQPTANEVLGLIKFFREKECLDDFVIYTGYYFREIYDFLLPIFLSQYPNIIIKFGRFVPNQEPHFDKVLGVNLASDNQYAERIS